MNTSAAALLAVTLLFTASTSIAAQGTTRLLGRVVDLEGNAVRDIRLRVVGHGEPEVFDSGEFELQLSGRPAQVEVTVIGDELEVLYPLRGQVAVPQDANVRVPVVVGRPERALINDVLAARFVQLESTLQRNGVRYDAAVEGLGEDVRRIVELLELKEADLRSSIELRRKQTDVKPALLRTFDAYLLELKDLKDAFRLVLPYAAGNRGALEALQRAVLEYNAAFEAVNNNRNAFMTGIRSFWERERAEGLERDLADVYTEILEEIQRPVVLPMNGSLLVLARVHSSQRPGKQEITEAVGAAEAAASRLETRINVLESRYARLREALERD